MLIDILTIFSVPEAPTSVKALVMSADSILVSWQQPERPNGIITQYTVYYKEHGKTDSEVSTLTPHRRTHFIIPLN